MTFFWLLLAALFWVANTGSTLVHHGAKPRGSQIPRQDIMQASSSGYACPVDPRVQVPARNTWGAPLGAKISGNANGFTTKARKRAFLRARSRAYRAQLKGGTWHRGQWRTAQSLGVPCGQTSATSAGMPTSQHRCPVGQGRQSRMRVLTYNVGGMSADLYDVCLDWLGSQTQADIVVLYRRPTGEWGRLRIPGQRLTGTLFLPRHRRNATRECVFVSPAALRQPATWGIRSMYRDGSCTCACMVPSSLLIS